MSSCTSNAISGAIQREMSPDLTCFLLLTVAPGDDRLMIQRKSKRKIAVALKPAKGQEANQFTRPVRI